MYELSAGEVPRIGVYGWRATKNDESETGFRSIAVPGAVAAIDELHRAHATLSWEEIAAPIEAPRIHTEASSPLLVESHFGDAVADGLRARGHDVLMKKEGLLSSWFGRPSGIHIDSENGCFHGGMEPYRVGIALGY